MKKVNLLTPEFDEKTSSFTWTRGPMVLFGIITSTKVLTCLVVLYRSMIIREDQMTNWITNLAAKKINNSLQDSGERLSNVEEEEMKETLNRLEYSLHQKEHVIQVDALIKYINLKKSIRGQNNEQGLPSSYYLLYIVVAVSLATYIIFTLISFFFFVLDFFQLLSLSNTDDISYLINFSPYLMVCTIIALSFLSLMYVYFWNRSYKQQIKKQMDMFVSVCRHVKIGVDVKEIEDEIKKFVKLVDLDSDLNKDEDYTKQTPESYLMFRKTGLVWKRQLSFPPLSSMQTKIIYLYLILSILTVFLISITIAPPAAPENGPLNYSSIALILFQISISTIIFIFFLFLFIVIGSIISIAYILFYNLSIYLSKKPEKLRRSHVTFMKKPPFLRLDLYHNTAPYVLLGSSIYTLFFATLAPVLPTISLLSNFSDFLRFLKLYAIIIPLLVNTIMFIYFINYLLYHREQDKQLKGHLNQSLDERELVIQNRFKEGTGDNVSKLDALRSRMKGGETVGSRKFSLFTISVLVFIITVLFEPLIFELLSLVF